MMTLLIEDFSLNVIVGVLKEERTKPQNVTIDAQISYGYSGHGFLDYMKICREIKKEFEIKKFRLLEEAAITVCETLKSKNPQIIKIGIKIVKPEVRGDAKVGIFFEKNFN